MIVLEASIVVELLMKGPGAEILRREMEAREESFAVPHLLDVEVVSALRSMVVGRQLDAHRISQLLADLKALPVDRYGHDALLGRMWELRHNFTAYDAVYIAMAEATDAVLYTCDEKLRKGHRARVVVFSAPDSR